MGNPKKLVTQKILLPLAGVAIFLAIWTIAAATMGKSIILPMPGEVFKSFTTLLGDATFYKAVFNTILRSFQSYVIAFGFALLIGITASLNVVIEKILSPLIVITRATPTMSIILLTLIWLSSKTAPMFVAFLVIFPLLYTGILDSIKRVDRGLINMSKIYKVPLRKTIFQLYLKETLPSIFTLMQSTISFNLKLVIAGEVLAYTGMSMGMLMQRSSAYLETATLLAWTMVAILIGYILELLVLLIKRLVVKWEK